MRHVHFLYAFGLFVGACIGKIGDGDGDGGEGRGSSPPATPVDSAGDPTIASKCSSTYSPGHVPIHRLTNDEYTNTVRELLHTSSRPGDAFAPSAVGRSGFSNDSDSLTISDERVDAYYSAAQALAKEVIASKATPNGAYSKLVTCTPSDACAQSTIAALGARAYRRPLTPAELTALRAVFNSQSDFDTGISDVVIALLMSPKFLFVYTTSPQSRVQDAVFPVDSYALAARLSYALWQSMPDDELSQLARDGKLSDPAIVRGQVARMLKDAKIESLLKSLRDDWAGLGAMAEPTGTLPGLQDSLRGSMVGEVDGFINDLVRSDRSFLSVLTGTSSFANEAMAKYYGVPFQGPDVNAFVKVNLPPNRRGIATSAAVLTNTAGDANYTHPVHRGKWVTNKILCTQIPPPPPGVPLVSFDPAQAGGATPRQRLESHVANPACIGCHKVMDAVGFGLENYDPFGKWRDSYPGIGPVDASGVLPSGEPFKQAAEMYDDIAREEQTQACLAQQVLGYVLTRAMTSSDDLCVSKAIGTASVTPTGTFSDLVTKIVGSRQFFMQTGEAP
jgi:hypothetical protein